MNDSTFLPYNLPLFLISREPDILQALCCSNVNAELRVDRATDKTEYDLGTRLLWLEAGFLSLVSGFPEHGIPALRRSSD